MFLSVGLFRVLELVILRVPPLPHLNVNASHKEIIINFPSSDTNINGEKRTLGQVETARGIKESAKPEAESEETRRK